MKKFLLNLQFLFKPAYWVMNRPYSKDMDEVMSHLLDKYEFKNVTEHTAYLGSEEIWIANQPYSSMVIHKYLSDCRPSRLTIKRGIDKLRKQGGQKPKYVIELQELKERLKQL